MDLVGNQFSTALMAVAGVFAALAIVPASSRFPRVQQLCVALCTVLAAVWTANKLVVHASNNAPSDVNDFVWRFAGNWSTGAVATAAVLSGLAILLSATAPLRMNTPARLAISALRTLAIVCAFVLFLQPSLRLQRVSHDNNHVAIIVDTSQSMTLVDKDGERSRLARVETLLRESKGTLADLASRHHVELLQFNDSLSPIEDVDAPLSPGGATSELHGALEQLRDLYRDRDFGGAIIISDGLATGPLGRKHFSADDIPTDAPIHTIAVGSGTIKDVAITAIHVPEFGFARTVVKVSVEITSSGYPARKIPLSLTEGDSVVRRQWAHIPEGTSTTKVEFEFPPKRVGDHVYRVRTDVDPAEAIATNNERPFVLRVLRERIRVLHVAGQPSWDVREVRRVLRSNPNIDLVSFFILRTNEDLTRASPDELALIPFPTRELFEEQLPSFDLVVLQNYNFGPYGLVQYLSNIRDFVAGGGALAVIGGGLSFSSGGYFGTPIAEALPVTLLPPRTTPLIDTKPFRLRLTAAGRRHPIFKLGIHPIDITQRLRELPKLEGVNLVAGAKPGATVIASHPKRRGNDGKLMPVLTVGEFKQGRVLTVGTDTLSNWGYAAGMAGQGDGHAHEQFWNSAIRWLIRDPEFQELKLEADQLTYAPGATATLAIIARTADFAPLADSTVVIEVTRDGAAAPLRQTVTTDSQGRGSAEVALDEPGVYRALASVRTGQHTRKASDVMVVTTAAGEFDRAAAETQLLEQIASVTGGSFASNPTRIPQGLKFAPPQIARVERAMDVEMWSWSWLIMLIIAVLCAEWGLRQLSRYR